MQTRFLVLGSTVLVVLCATGCSLLKKAGSSDAGAGDATAPAVAVVDAAAPGVDAAAPAPKTSSTAAAPVKSAAPAGKGECSCLPDQGSVNHGNNMRLAPTWRSPACTCTSSGVSLCLTPIKACKERGTACNESFGDLCKAKGGFKGAAGATCQGWSSVGEKESGQLGCEFDHGVDTYPKPAGAVCTGFTVDNKSAKGHVFCR